MAQITTTPDTRRFSLKTALVLGVVFVIEGLVIAGAFMFAGAPAQVSGDDGVADVQATLAEEPVEELVIAEKFQNTRDGRTFIFDAEVYIVIKRKHQARVQGLLREREARISMDIATLYRAASPTQLMEPTLATLRRQIKAALDEAIGTDEDGRSIVQDVLIPKNSRFRADL